MGVGLPTQALAELLAELKILNAKLDRLIEIQLQQLEHSRSRGSQRMSGALREITLPDAPERAT